MTRAHERRIAGRSARCRLAVQTLLVCVAASSAIAAAADHRYRVAIDPALGQLQVEAHFAEPVYRVSVRSSRAAGFVSDLRDCERSAALRTHNRRLVIPTGGLQCLSYRVNLHEAAKTQRHNRGLHAANIIVSPSLWLWRPTSSMHSSVLVDFELPDGVQVSVPWEPRDTSGRRFVVRPSPQSANAPVAFGRFDQRTIDVPGATLRVSVMRGKQPVDSDSILRWVEAAATDVTLAYGSFPHPSPQVLVIPVAGARRHRGGAVPFGRVVRDGGETIELFINQQKPLDAFLDDWTATHEFSHLMLPYVERRHRWISEGFAQYYQNVLLARSGAYDQVRAWQKLYEGLERGRASLPGVSPNGAARSGSRSGTMKIYWSGAALALMADVELRKRSGGKQTLDTVLQDLKACCLPSSRAWSGRELFAKLDALAGHNVFTRLYDQHANKPGFPDTAPTFARLGLDIDHDRVQIRSSASLAGIRDAITAVDPAIASWRRQLAARND